MPYDIIVNILVTLGLLLLSVGAFLIYAPAGVIVAGLECVAAGYLLAVRR